MPIDSRDLDGGVGNVIVARGVVTEDEFSSFYEKHLRQPAEKHKAYRYSLSDYTAVSRFIVPVNAIRWLARTAKEASQINPDAIVAVVASKDFLFGLARMWVLLMNSVKWEIEIFRSRPEAVAWVERRVKEKYGLTGIALD